MTVRDAVTCDKSACMAVFLERDAMPEGVAFEEDLRAHGWTYDEKAGHRCPACSAGRFIVLELGDCPRCMGRVGLHVDGERCMSCLYVLPEPDDVEDDDQDDDELGEQAPACAKCRTPFDPADTRHHGRARYSLTDYCRRCVDNCHEGSAEHVCMICDPDRYRV